MQCFTNNQIKIINLSCGILLFSIYERFIGGGREINPRIITVAGIFQLLEFTYTFIEVIWINPSKAGLSIFPIIKIFI